MAVPASLQSTIELRDLRIALGGVTLEAARAVLSGVNLALGSDDAGTSPPASAASVHVESLRLELRSFAAPAAPAAAARAAWQFDTLAGLDGELRIHIDDAVWQLDADVTLPIRQGVIDFNRVTVEHAGPDSSMGLSPMGLYVDAPNGRHYLYLFDTTHVPGARFERRGLLGARVADRGVLALQPLAEAIAGGATIGEAASHAQGLLARTRFEGRLRLGDGVLRGALGGRTFELTLSAGTPGHNRVELDSAAGGALVLRMAALSATSLHWGAPGDPGPGQ